MGERRVVPVGELGAGLESALRQRYGAVAFEQLADGPQEDVVVAIASSGSGVRRQHL